MVKDAARRAVKSRLADLQVFGREERYGKADLFGDCVT